VLGLQRFYHMPSYQMYQMLSDYQTRRWLLALVLQSVFPHATLSDVNRMSFKMNYLAFLSAAVAKIVEGSSLRYGIVHAISCLLPRHIASTPILVERRMPELAQTMYEKGFIAAAGAHALMKCKANLLISVKFI